MTKNNKTPSAKITASRERLRNAIGLSKTNKDRKNSPKYTSEIRHEKQVPFEGTVHVGAGYSLSSKEISEKYNSSMPSIWGIIAQSILAPLYQIKRFSLNNFS